MTITSTGYDGTVDEVAFAAMAAGFGSPYDVEDASHLKVVGTGTGQTTQVAAGSSNGYGVRVTTDAPVNVTSAALGSGTRWDLIALRRDWSGTGGTSSFVSVTGTSAAVIPAATNSNPGVIDDEPLALVQWTFGQSFPTQIVDLRNFASKMVTVGDLRGIKVPRHGDQARVGGVIYRRELDIGGSPVWNNPAGYTTYTPVWFASVGGTSVGSGQLTGRYRLDNGKTCHLMLWLAMASDTSGGVGDWSFSYPPGIVPRVDIAREIWAYTKVYVPLAGGTFPAHTWCRSDRMYCYAPQFAADVRMINIRNTDSGGGTNVSVPWAPNTYAWQSGANLMINATFEVA